LLREGIGVRDLDSTNGTFYLDQRLSRAVLRPGSRITLGRSAIDLLPAQDARAVGSAPRGRYGDLVGNSAAMQQLYAQLARIEATDASVLICGETGTGKELVARAIHAHSRRKAAPFRVVDCGNLNRELVGSTLFGHKKGAFTGATADQHGIFEAANGGTVLLDEIGELPLELQPRLLRVLETGQVTRIGETEAFVVDVRTLCATHRDLRQQANDGTFREDLYYRLAVLSVQTPPLRQRREDIPALIDHIAQQLGAEPEALPQVARDFMVQQDWPGNVRELRNAVQRVLVMGAMALPEVDYDHAESADSARAPGAPGAPPVDLSVDFHRAKQRAIEDFETAYLRELLRLADGNVSKAARNAGLDRKYLRALLKRRGLHS
jgi:DNA-binding NtrC family response regulator